MLNVYGWHAGEVETSSSGLVAPCACRAGTTLFLNYPWRCNQRMGPSPGTNPNNLITLEPYFESHARLSCSLPVKSCQVAFGVSRLMKALDKFMVCRKGCTSMHLRQNEYNIFEVIQAFPLLSNVVSHRTRNYHSQPYSLHTALRPRHLVSPATAYIPGTY
jgi:hypothetical protein